MSQESQFEKVMARMNRAVQESQAFAHVLVEHGVTPGKCRCEDCRFTAKKMDEAGYLNYVMDRWWIETQECEQCDGSGVQSYGETCLTCGGEGAIEST
jgi:RecJ-like exonuclease